MPTYVYRCQSCGTRFEAWQKMSDEPLKVCPTCSGEVHRVLFPPTITFKGSGFYITDHRSSGTTGSVDSGSTSSEPSTPAASTTTDTTTTKSDAKVAASTGSAGE